MKYSVKDLSTALNSGADALGLDLELEVKTPFLIYGGRRKDLTVAGQIVETFPTVVDSYVDTHRGLILLAVRLVGDLGAVLIIDAENSKLQLFLLDTTKLVKTMSLVLPKFWLRGELYKNIVPGLKATFAADFYGGKGWSLQHKGSAWIKDYLKEKKERVVGTINHPTL